MQINYITGNNNLNIQIHVKCLSVEHSRNVLTECHALHMVSVYLMVEKTFIEYKISTSIFKYKHIFPRTDSYKNNTCDTKRVEFA